MGSELMSATIPLWFSVSALAAAAAFGMSGLLLWKDRSSPFNRTVASVLLATCLIHLGNGVGVLDGSRALVWRRLALVAELAQAVALLYVALAVMAVTFSVVDARVRWRAHVIAVLAGVFAVVACSDLVFVMEGVGSDRSVIKLGSLGHVVYVFLLLSWALGIAQLESLLRVIPDPVRYRLKFVFIGIGALAGYQIYQASQLLLLSVWAEEQALIASFTTLISLGLVTFGLGRSRWREVRAKVSVSPRALYGSLSFILIGLYLLTVGVIGEAVRLTGWPLSGALSTLVVFIGAIGLVAVLLSRQARAELRRFVSRHFYRSKYDYRAKWLEVTEAFRTASSEDAILDQLLGVLSRTFGAGRISIWMRYEADGRFHQARSVNTLGGPQPLAASHPVVVRLVSCDEPVLLDLHRGEGGSDPFLEATQAALCAPIRRGGELIAFVALSRELQGERYGADDCDLLRAITHHVGMLLSHARLAEERRVAAELEALHRFSAFCLHDLKNMAARLSLVVQNAEVHGQDPAFWASAMQTVSGTVKTMMAMTTRLLVEAVQPGVPECVDVQELIAETVISMNGGLVAPVEVGGERVTPVRIVREQLQQVLLNVILNAQQAIQQADCPAGDRGRVRIRTEQMNGSVVVTVADTGPGIGPDELRTLFQPFRTSKPGGLGIGLYECKRIIESHQGTIRVESKVGQGTTVTIKLPI